MIKTYKPFLLLFLLLLFFKNSFAQYPFYGFELSNYEVGDTLEYCSHNDYYDIQNGNVYTQCIDTDLYLITNKDVFPGNDSIKYTITDIGNGGCFFSGDFHNSQGVFTIIRIVNNNSIIGSYSNIVEVLLDSLNIDTSGITLPVDSSYYMMYDTINNLKRLRLKMLYSSGNYQYEVLQNLGVINISEEIPNSTVSTYWDEILIYANLAHYGIYGKYEYISDGINNPVHLQTNISIRYDNGGNALLFYSSTENQQPILAVYDLLGREVETQLINTGANLIDSHNLAAGVYLYRVSSEENMLGQGKLLLLKNNL